MVSYQPVGLLYIKQYKTHPQRRVCLHALQFFSSSYVFLVYRLHNRRRAAKRDLYICREQTNNALEPTETKRALFFPTPTTQTLSFLWRFYWRQKLQRSAKERHFLRPRARALVQSRFNTGAASLIHEMLREFSILKFKVIEHDVPIANKQIPRNRTLC